MLRLRFGLFAACALAAVPALGQASYNGSLYSRYGVGERASDASAPGFAMGGGGLALSSFGFVNPSNPATLGQQFLTRFAVGGQVQTVAIEDGAGATGERTEAGLGSAALAFPLRTNRVGVGVHFAPVSRTSYGASTLGKAIGLPDAPNDTVDYEVGYEGSGGLSRLEAGAGVRLTRGFYVGASAGATFGILDQRRRITFEPTDSPGYAEQIFLTSTRLVGFSARAGALLRLDSLGAPTRRLHLAATVELPTTLHGRRTVTLSPTQVLNPDTLSTSGEGTMRLPLGAALGVAFMPDAKWTFVADGRYEPWSSFESDFPLDGYTNANANRMADRLRISAGAEVIPGALAYNPPYLKRLSYRIGGYYDSGYVLTPAASGAGDRLPTVGITAGIGFPALLPGTSLDLGFEVGQRGKAQTSPVPLVQDRFFKVSLTANFGERWFERPRLN